ncbi:MAG: amidohydrolase/deacetylase family metallohydrolase [Acidobacteria bacterium]|nr:amidohydrolase/deacetylase family metallohydrolase [Acidobacteriota bacterium]
MRARFLCLLAALALSALPGSAQRYDLLLNDGFVIDPANGINGHRDVAIADGKIAAVAEEIDPREAKRVFEVKGLFVTPGLIDLHAHVFSTTGIPGAWAGDLSVQADALSFRTGVTTLVDAGSSGWRNFEIFRQTVIDRAATRVLSLINIAGFGMITDITEQKDFDPEEVARLAKKHSDVVVGVKSAHYRGKDWASVENAVKAGTLADIPVMVDFGYFWPDRPFYELVLDKLRPGDMPTHCFRAPVPWVDKDGKLYDYLYKARKRGIKFDVGHGGGSFVFRNAVPAIQAGFYPDSISTDLHVSSMVGGMMDMPSLMSKFLAMGMPLEAVIRASTWNPAQQIGRDDLGKLTPGAVADVAVFRLMRGEFRFRDASNGAMSGTERLHAEATIKDGRVRWDWNSLSGVDYKTLGPTYGVRGGFDNIVPPPAEK